MLSSNSRPIGWSLASRISHSSRSSERQPFRRSTPAFCPVADSITSYAAEKSMICGAP